MSTGSCCQNSSIEKEFKRKNNYGPTSNFVTAKRAIDDLCRYAYLAGSIKDGVVVVENIYIPKQTPSGGATTINEPLVEVVAAIQDSGAIIVGEVLSHGSMSVFESRISEKSRKKLSGDLNRSTILLVVNTRGEHQLFQ